MKKNKYLQFIFNCCFENNKVLKTFLKDDEKISI